MAHRPDSLVIRSRVDYGTAILKNVFITTLKKVATVSVACELLGLRRSTVYEWRNEDADFKERWEDALILAGESMESATYLKLAGVLQDDRKRLSMPEAKLIEMFLSGAKPEKYKQTPLTVDNSINFTNTIDWTQVPDDVFNAFNAGQLTLKDVYDCTIQLKEQERSATSEDRRPEGGGAT